MIYIGLISQQFLVSVWSTLVKQAPGYAFVTLASPWELIWGLSKDSFGPEVPRRKLGLRVFLNKSIIHLFP